MTSPSRRRRKLNLIERRISFLEDRISLMQLKGRSYDEAELAALRWAHGALTKACDTGLIADLEPDRDSYDEI